MKAFRGFNLFTLFSLILDEEFLTYGKNSTYVDYSSAMVDIVQINLLFEASSAFKLVWYRDKARIEVPEYISGKINVAPPDAKLVTSCLKKSLHSYECFLQYLQFSDKDIGEHVAEISLLESPEKSIKLNVTVIMPSKYLWTTKNHFHYDPKESNDKF